MTERLHRLPERHRRLGRHVEHDERSKDYPAKRAAAVKSVRWKRHCPAFDQGNLGSCTGNAMAGALMTGPLWDGVSRLTEQDALHLYTQASYLDRIPGSYPPHDTGSSALAVAKAAKLERYITSYTHAFGLQHLLEALTLGPGILGVDWYPSFDRPHRTGECAIEKGDEPSGGHEVQMFALDARAKRVWCYNSWGPTWGPKRDGTFWFSFDTLGRLLKRHGDALFPVREAPKARRRSRKR
jgi:hypothetical protein